MLTSDINKEFFSLKTILLMTLLNLHDFHNDYNRIACIWTHENYFRVETVILCAYKRQHSNFSPNRPCFDTQQYVRLDSTSKDIIYQKSSVKCNHKRTMIYFIFWRYQVNNRKCQKQQYNRQPFCKRIYFVFSDLENIKIAYVLIYLYNVQ